MVMQAINEHISRFVKDTGTTKDAIAARIGLSRSAFYTRTNGTRPWILDEVIALADVLGITIQELITPIEDEQR